MKGGPGSSDRWLRGRVTSQFRLQGKNHVQGPTRIYSGLHRPQMIEEDARDTADRLEWGLPTDSCIAIWRLDQRPQTAGKRASLAADNFNSITTWRLDTVRYDSVVSTSSCNHWAT